MATHLDQPSKWDQLVNSRLASRLVEGAKNVVPVNGFREVV